MRVIAYTYEADVHCPNCTKKRSMLLPENGGFLVSDFHPHAVKPYGQEDANHIPYNSIDREGNLIHPVHDIDEHDLTHCGTCHEEL